MPTDFPLTPTSILSVLKNLSFTSKGFVFVFCFFLKGLVLFLLSNKSTSQSGVGDFLHLPHFASHRREKDPTEPSLCLVRGQRGGGVSGGKISRSGSHRCFGRTGHKRERVCRGGPPDMSPHPLKPSGISSLPCGCYCFFPLVLE